LFDLADDKYAVMVVKHTTDGRNYKLKRKMDDQLQSYYPKKNWSSVVLWNCEHPSNKRLTLEALNGLPGRDLHAFCWLQDDEIGTLPQHWNWLVNVTSGEPEKLGIWHFTEGGPWIENWKPAKYDEEWKQQGSKRMINGELHGAGEDGILFHSECHHCRRVVLESAGLVLQS
jgi:hypothetical protein